MEYVTAKGVEVPALGFGTARMDTDDERYRAVSTALETGYRHVDTAQVYGSERAVGDALADSDVDRADVFLTTKLADGNRDDRSVRESTRASLDRLDTEYVDLLLIHAPNDDVSHEETLNAMSDLRDDGLVRHVGVSNFSVEQTREAEALSDAPILTNQVEYHVRHRQDDLLAYCVENDVLLTAYSPLGVGDVLGDESVQAVAERHGKAASQVAIRWLLQQPTVAAIPMSSDPAHVRENFDVFDFELSGDEMRELFALGEAVDDDFAARLGL
ncbi:aldo/keto reductase [Halomicrobium salinisoli]|uniref:aldo/keto reductase n=1 Tax=Halomicrobium salinisoli TaxID=2878391 RepID=UPI001CF07421|nr:aldo/keto reductase [Halomicrobium salinisoli]